MRRKTTSIYLEKEVEDALKRTAILYGKSVSEVASDLIKSGLFGEQKTEKIEPEMIEIAVKNALKSANLNSKNAGESAGFDDKKLENLSKFLGENLIFLREFLIEFSSKMNAGACGESSKTAKKRLDFYDEIVKKILAGEIKNL